MKITIDGKPISNYLINKYIIQTHKNSKEDDAPKGRGRRPKSVPQDDSYQSKKKQKTDESGNEQEESQKK